MNRSGLRLELMKAEDPHREWLRMERDALNAIEARANELGQTTIRESASAKNADPAFSREDADKPSGSTVNSIAAAIKKAYGNVLDKLQANGLVTLTQTQDEAIEAAARARAKATGVTVDEARAGLRESFTDDGADGIEPHFSQDGSIQGFYDSVSGKSFLIADGMTDGAAAGVLAHEVGIHMAADTTSERGKAAMDDLIGRAADLLANDNSAFMDDVRQRMDDAGETSAEEAAAYIAEAYEADRANAPASIKRWVMDFVAAVRGWLFAKGVTVRAGSLTPADIAAIARANVRRAANARGDGDSRGDVRRSMADHAATKQNDNRWREAAKVLLKLANEKDLFQQPKVSSSSFAEILNQIEPSAKLKNVSPDSDEFIGDKKTLPEGYEFVGQHTVTMPSGGTAYAVVMRPLGKGARQVYVDISDLKSGAGRGNAFYGAVAAWAHNARMEFVPDPNGLSRLGVLRRTEMMLSSALKYGTTRHLKPDDTQTAPLFAGIHPLKWGRNDISNIAQLLETSANNVTNFVPETANLRYNFEHGYYYDQQTNERVGEARFAELADGARAAEAGIGKATLKRTAISQSLVQGEVRGAERRGVFERIARQLHSGGELNPAVRGVYYSRDGDVRRSMADNSGQVGDFNGKNGGKEVKYTDGKKDRYAAAESRLVQGLSAAGIFERGSGRLVSRQSAEQASLYTDNGSRPRPHGIRARSDALDREEARLIARAKSEGFFWSKDTVRDIETLLGKRTTSGTEHDVYMVGDVPNRVVIRNTVKDSYGFAHTSPAQYLQRLADYNRVFPHLQVRMLGVSQNARGNGVVWTAQPFVAGREYKSDAALRRALEAQGWEHLGELEYRHKQTGVVIDDAHKGNVLYRGGELFPIDVIVTHIPDRFGGSGNPETATQPDADSSDIRFSRARAKPNPDQVSENADLNAKIRESDKTLWVKAQTAYQRLIRTNGLLPGAVFDAHRFAERMIKGDDFETSARIGALEAAVKHDYGKSMDDLPAETLRLLNEATMGRFDLSQVKPNVRRELSHPKRNSSLPPSDRPVAVADLYSPSLVAT
ncbi:hypothetical protein [Sinimarinibacterium sp. NLF-5-8]|uniref:putative polyvalent protein kinase domain-containing protein n=1 Tax=Sinimarinibacterium sp. NLF-5-8 TaxID=2698684 RepID=UPI00137BE4B0|nr:hypothetical protein [Sinimarinibacterium sp. NLF-5-8]QHS08757.1 hypothetical protein GT972_00450 [Sinimarinibacterium sp. NLF-5-8]